MNWYTPLAILAFSLFFWSYAHAHDPSHEELDQWYANLRQPDQPSVSCCGEGDAYWCDIIHVRGGRTYCTITDDRDDRKLKRNHVPLGREVFIPDFKLTWKDGNPTGHAIVFMTSNGPTLEGGSARENVFCFVQNGGV
jgi:hypothetical protein